MLGKFSFVTLTSYTRDQFEKREENLQGPVFSKNFYSGPFLRMKINR